MSAINDAQHLVTLSLGKLAHTRTQRGGPQLHKALLLSTVLNKAREAFFNERRTQSPTPAILQRQQSVSAPEVKPAQPEVTPPVLTPVSQNKTTDQLDTKKSETEPSKGIKPSVPEVSSSKPSSPAKRSRSCSRDKENTIPSSAPRAYEKTLPGNASHLSEPACKKSRPESDPGSFREKRQIPDDLEGPSDCKRQRVCDTNDDCDASSAVSKLDTAQISSLVNCFNSGLSGLSSSADAKDSDRSTSQKSASSCRTVQVKEGFHSMARWCMEHFCSKMHCEARLLLQGIENLYLTNQDVVIRHEQYNYKIQTQYLVQGKVSRTST